MSKKNELYEGNLKNNVVVISGSVDSGMAGSFLTVIQYLLARKRKSKRAISIYLNTPGGDVIPGLAIYDTIIEARKKAPIHIYANGYCMSMGLIILQAGTKRFTYPHTAFMFHEVHGGVSGGSLTKATSELKEVERIQKILDGIISTRSKISAEKIRESLKGQEWYITAEQALQFKLVDKIL